MPHDWDHWQDMEREAKRLTWHAWIDRDVGRLFPLPEIVAVRQRVTMPRWWGERNARVWRALDEEFGGRAIGVVPPMDHLVKRGLEYTCVAGVWGGIRPDFFGGSSLDLVSFNGLGSSLRRSPFNIGFVYVLPDRPFQHRARHMWDSDDDVRCGNCDYLFGDEEDPCDCHLLCGSCCHGERAREAVREAVHST